MDQSIDTIRSTNDEVDWSASVDMLDEFTRKPRNYVELVTARLLELPADFVQNGGDRSGTENIDFSGRNCRDVSEHEK
jgi:hypothetical protein